MTAAARGVVALLVGNRRASDYFDFSDRGLVGSFIAFLVVTAVNASLPMILGIESGGGLVFRAVAMVAIVFALQIGCAALALRQLKRLDELIPYVVAYNWTNALITLGVTVVVIAGLSGDFVVIVVLILALAIEINIARLIVTLSAWQIAMFLIAQLVGGSIGLLVVGSLFPMPPTALSSPPV
jgi:hypothetical protein